MRVEHCAAIQQRLNIFEGSEETLALCEAENLASINRGPLAMGLLTGKFNPESTLPANDVRRDWDFRSGPQAKRLRMLEELLEVLTAGGRTLAQARWAGCGRERGHRPDPRLQDCGAGGGERRGAGV